MNRARAVSHRAAAVAARRATTLLARQASPGLSSQMPHEAARSNSWDTTPRVQHHRHFTGLRPLLLNTTHTERRWCCQMDTPSSQAIPGHRSPMCLRCVCFCLQTWPAAMMVIVCWALFGPTVVKRHPSLDLPILCTLVVIFRLHFVCSMYRTRYYFYHYHYFMKISKQDMLKNY